MDLLRGKDSPPIACVWRYCFHDISVGAMISAARRASGREMPQ